MIDTGVKLSIVATSAPRGADVELHPVHRERRQLLARDPDAVFLANGPGRPGRARLHRRHRPRARRQASGVRDLPGPPAAVPRGRARDLQAPVRPPRRQPPGQGSDHRPDRDHQPEPRLRGARPRTARRRSTTTSRSAGSTDFGEAELTPRQPLRPHGRGAGAARRARRHRPVPPRGRTRAARRACTCSTGSSTEIGAAARTMPRRDDIQQDPPDRLRADRDRPGGRVRLLGHPGLPGAAWRRATRSCSSTPTRRRS